MFEIFRRPDLKLVENNLLCVNDSGPLNCGDNLTAEHDYACHTRGLALILPLNQYGLLQNISACKILRTPFKSNPLNVVEPYATTSNLCGSEGITAVYVARRGLLHNFDEASICIDLLGTDNY